MERYGAAALGSQLKSLYRNGGQAVCAHKLSDFKFCLSLKALEPEEKRKEWIERRAAWWAERRVGRSSEDVWNVRRCVSLPYLVIVVIHLHLLHGIPIGLL